MISYLACLMGHPFDIAKVSICVRWASSHFLFIFFVVLYGF